MVDVETPPAKTPDRTVRNAALWAAAIAIPIALVAGLLIFERVVPSGEKAQPAASGSAPQAVPSTPVAMQAATLTAATAKACLAFTSQLPDTLRTLPERSVTAGSEQNVAYGEPAITAACGVTQPTECERTTGGHPGCVPLDSDMMVTNGVCWYTQAGKNGENTFTTMDRAVPVRLVIPGAYEQQAGWANEFTDSIEQTIPARQAAAVPTGCKDEPTAVTPSASATS